MHVRLGIVMDPIDRISFKKDSSWYSAVEKTGGIR